MTLGITAAGTMIAGPIGAIAGGGVGKLIANGLSGQDTNKETVSGWKCNRCGHTWYLLLYFA